MTDDIPALIKRLRDPYHSREEALAAAELLSRLTGAPK